MNKKILDEKMDKLHSQILKEWDLCGSPFKDITKVIVRDFGVENNTKDEMNIVLKKFTEDIINKIYNGIENSLGNFGLCNLRIIFKEWIQDSIGEELQKRVKQVSDGRADDKPAQSNLINVAEGGLSYIH